MTQCLHANRRCLNHYDTFRKYHCPGCGGTFICECEKEIVTVLFPHQSRVGGEAGTADEYPVTGFARVCAPCRGEKEEAHPRSQIYGQKKKLDRYYWREIDLTSLRRVLDHLKVHRETVKDVFEFDLKFPGVREQFEKEARRFWLHQHEKQPLYSYNEQSEDHFLKEVPVRTIVLSAPYVNRDGKGLWVTESGKELCAEAFVADYCMREGYEVHRCERGIVSTLVAAYLWTPVNYPDEKLRIVGIRSRGKFSKTPASEFNKHGLLFLQLPRDFGSKEFFGRKKRDFREWFKLLRGSGQLIDQYDYCLNVSRHLRDYLWVNNDAAEAATRAFLKTVPDEITFKIIEWAAGDFWNRQPGWPDLFVVKGPEHLFIEVKGPNDRLSPDQMNWFEKMVGDKLLNCRIVRLRKSSSKEPDSPKSPA